MSSPRMVRFGSVDKAMHRLVLLLSAMVMLTIVVASLLPPSTFVSDPALYVGTE